MNSVQTPVSAAQLREMSAVHEMALCSGLGGELESRERKYISAASTNAISPLQNERRLACLLAHK